MQRNPTHPDNVGGRNLSLVARAAGVLAALALLTGCETLTAPTPAGAGAESPAVEAPEPYSYKRAFELLFEGQAGRAERMLEARLATHPGDDRARFLLRQIQEDPEEYLGQSSFEYRVKPGESLSVLSQRFLGTYTLFFILARYNDIAAPSLLREGQVLRIPEDYDTEAPAGTRPMPAKSGEAISPESLDGRAGEATQQDEPSPEDTLANYAGVDVAALGPAEIEKLGAAYRQSIDEALVRGAAGEASDRLAEAARRAPADGRWADWLDDMKQRAKAEAAYREGLDLRKLEPAAAAQAFNRALDVDPDHDGAHAALVELRQQTVPRLHQQAVILYRNQDLEEAIDLWNQILAINPDFEPAQGYRARAMELSRRLEELE